MAVEQPGDHDATTMTVQGNQGPRPRDDSFGRPRSTRGSKSDSDSDEYSFWNFSLFVRSFVLFIAVWKYMFPRPATAIRGTTPIRASVGADSDGRNLERHSEELHRPTYDEPRLITAVDSLVERSDRPTYNELGLMTAVDSELVRSDSPIYTETQVFSVPYQSTEPCLIASQIARSDSSTYDEPGWISAVKSEVERSDRPTYAAEVERSDRPIYDELCLITEPCLITEVALVERSDRPEPWVLNASRVARSDRPTYDEPGWITAVESEVVRSDRPTYDETQVFSVPYNVSVEDLSMPWETISIPLENDVSEEPLLTTKEAPRFVERDMAVQLHDMPDLGFRYTQNVSGPRATSSILSATGSDDLDIYSDEFAIVVERQIGSDAIVEESCLSTTSSISELDGDDPERCVHTPRETDTSEKKPLKTEEPGIGKQISHHDDAEYSCCDILLHLFSVGSYLADIGTDIFLAYLYFCEGHWWWFGLTLAFILVPSLTITAFSVAWYYQEHAHNKENNVQIHNARWVSRLIFHILQIGPVIRYVDTMVYGCKSRPTGKSDKSQLGPFMRRVDATVNKCKNRLIAKNKPEPENTRKKKHWYDMMVYENSDACTLRLIECFMEAAPQLVLQIYIMSRFGVKKSAVLFIGQMLSCLLSLCSLAWSLVAFQRAMLLSRPGGTSNRPVRGLNKEWLRMILRMVLQFCWHLFIIAARVLSLALFASRFTFWVGIVCVVHFIIMLAWLKPQSTNFCRGKQLQEFCFKVTMAGLYIFSDLDLPAGHTRLRYLFYYCIVYVENSFMILMWFFHTETTWYAVLAVVVVLVGFLIGVASQAIYYLCAHPNNFLPVQQGHPKKSIKLRLSSNEHVSFI